MAYFINDKCVRSNFVVWDEEYEPCLFLNFDKITPIYWLLNYRLKDEIGSYAYSDNIEDLITLREELIKDSRFKPLELFIKAIVNFNLTIKK